MKKYSRNARNAAVKCAMLMIFFASAIFSTHEISAQDSIGDGTSLKIYSDNKKYGFKDADENIVIPAIYTDVRAFSEGYAAVNTGGKLRNVKVSDAFGSFPAVYTKKITGGKWGFVDVTGKEIAPCKYEYVDNFSNNRALVKSGKLYGFIDETGNEICPLKYDDAGTFCDDRAWVKSKKLYGYINETGNEIIPLKYNGANDFSEGLALINFKGKYGFVDKTGNESIPLKYDFARSFSDGLAAVNVGGQWSSIDPEFSAVFGNALQGYVSFKGGKWGFINTNGEVVIPFIYDNAESFSKGTAQVVLNGSPQTIDKPQENE
ncbi:MAG: WG repeat-containing protein [Prevotellaceae bacterium]|jgi:hypothetical protein|nr:WG repeat-containing protein [Prevotellaceae bacterium]